MHRQRGREMLQDRNAQREWVIEGSGPKGASDKGTISGWRIGETFVLLHEYYDGNGFDIYQPVNKENTLPALANALDELCGSVVNTPEDMPELHRDQVWP